MSTETTRFIGDGEKGGKGVWRWEKGEIIYLSLHCHLQNDSCIKKGSKESHFHASLIVPDKVTRQCPQTTIFEEKGELKRIRTEDPLLTSLTPYRPSMTKAGNIYRLPSRRGRPVSRSGLAVRR